MPALHSILVPLDGSSPSLAALDHAVALAEDTGASIDVLHVEAPEEFSIGSTTPLAPEVRRDIDAALDSAVEQARARIGAGRVSRRNASGEPFRTIVETARDGGYHLIVIGTHGRIGRLHELTGSVAEELLRNAPCPVLVVREPGAGYQSFAERRHGRPSVLEQSPEHHR